jgi:hypothetical protein
MRNALASWRATGLLIEPSMAAVALISLLGRDRPEAAETERERWEPLDAPGFKAFIERELAKPSVAAGGVAAGRARVQVAEPAGTARID